MLANHLSWRVLVAAIVLPAAIAGTFLASWLSVLRATGYRLVRQRKG
jgi:hypothetical protein